MIGADGVGHADGECTISTKPAIALTPLALRISIDLETVRVGDPIRPGYECRGRTDETPRTDQGCSARIGGTRPARIAGATDAIAATATTPAINPASCGSTPMVNPLPIPSTYSPSTP